MPFKSKAQQGFMFAAQARGEIPKGTAERWARHTPNIKSLPKRVGKKKRKGGGKRWGGVREAIAARSGGK